MGLDNIVQVQIYFQNCMCPIDSALNVDPFNDLGLLGKRSHLRLRAETNMV